MFENLVEVLKANPRKIVYTEGTDARILESAARLKQGGFLTPILVGNVEDVKAAAKAGNFDIEGLEIIDPANYDKMDEMAQCMFDLRKGKMTMEEVRANLQKGNYFGTMLVKMGVADALLGGATYSTADTVRPALQLIKTKKGAHLVSSCFIMVRGDEMLAMGDCAINIDYQDTVDKATGEPVADASGVPVEAKAEFAPALSTGSQDVEIAFDASLLGGRDLVAFESLRKDEAEVASHADLSDEGQTVHVAVEVGTQAADAADGDQVIEAGKAKVIDTVAYKGLVPGETYIAVGTLMDKGTGEPFLDKDGNEVTARTPFEPEAPSGTVEVTFEFDTEGLAEGDELVVFEKVLDSAGNVVAAHEDIDSAEQSVVVDNPGTPEVPEEPYAKTGADAPDGTGYAVAAGIALAAAAGAGGALAYRKRKTAGASKDAADEEPEE